jgi:YidC/Oxa1 family membrane protein insertase
MTPEVLGELSPESAIRQRVQITPVGAGVSAIELGRYFDSVKRESNVDIQRVHASGGLSVTPLAVLGLTVNRTVVDLLKPDVWRRAEGGGPGVYEAYIVNGSGERILRVERAYVLRPDSYEIELIQRVENLSGRELDVRWFQFGPVDLDNDMLGATNARGRDMRRVRFGYLLKPSADPTRKLVFANDYLWARTKAFGKRLKSGLYKDVDDLWPNKVSVDSGYELAWAGMTNRYFGVVVHPLVEPDDASAAFGWVEKIERVVLNRRDPVTGDDTSVIAMRLQSREMKMAAGGTADVSMGVYAGPLEQDAIGLGSHAKSAGVPEIVVYNVGGPCAFCTFPFLTDALLWLLERVHRASGDWAIAIIVLVVIVRSILHPVTRWSQIRLQRFAKQMQDIAPKQKKIQERYADDKQKLQQETAKLWREEGINPAGMLGCLPMFLQTPVWIALYATLFYAFELRQQGAFYGVFQTMTGGAWNFMSDLAEPDHVIWFAGKGFNIPLISGLMGPITGINILPLVWAVVFWVHQKYLTPPTSGMMTPEQQQQQKIIKVMSVVMLPVFMYNAPSGLLVYFLTNSVLAIVEAHWIRKHVTKHDLLNPEKYKKVRKQPGFMARLQALAEQQQAKQAGKGGMGQKGGMGGRGPQSRGPAPRGPKRPR